MLQVGGLHDQARARSCLTTHRHSRSSEAERVPEARPHRKVLTVSGSMPAFKKRCHSLSDRLIRLNA